MTIRKIFTQIEEENILNNKTTSTWTDKQDELMSNFIYDAEDYRPINQKEYNYLVEIVKRYNTHTNTLYGIVDVIYPNYFADGNLFFIISDHPAGDTLREALYEDNVTVCSNLLPKNLSPNKNSSIFAESIDNTVEPTSEEIDFLLFVLERYLYSGLGNTKLIIQFLSKHIGLVNSINLDKYNNARKEINKYVNQT
jgi:hypothetical protein